MQDIIAALISFFLIEPVQAHIAERYADMGLSAQAAAEAAAFYKHLNFAGVPIVTLAEGEITELHVGLKGTMNALLLKDLAAKTHRGLRGRVEDGKSGGGLCYGYKVVKKVDERGEPVRGDREIDEAEAGVVHRIFRDFAAGIGPRTIRGC